MAFEFKVLKSDGTTADVGAKGVVASLTRAEFSALTSKAIAEHYTNGVRAIIVEDGYTNLVPSAIGENGEIYYGCGYLNGYRLNSIGGLTLADGACVSGYVPYTNGSVVRIIGSRQTVSAGGQYIAMYDSSFDLIDVSYMSSLVSGGNATYTSGKDGVYVLTVDTGKISSWNGATYFRVSCSACMGSELVSTDKEEIGLEV